jgi:transcription initiation factor TFIIF subunit alpha
MSSLSIRAPKKKKPVPLAQRPSVTAAPAIKREPIEVPVDTRTWTDYTLRAGAAGPVASRDGGLGPGEAMDEDGNDRQPQRGTKYNIMRFHGTKRIDPSTDLARPVRLCRRDPFEALVTAVAAEDGAEGAGGAAATANTAPLDNVAPYAGAGSRRSNKKKTRQVYQADEQVYKLRQEEKYPWILEDFEGKATFQGTLEGGQAHTYVFMTLSKDGFVVTPISKFYRFQPRARYSTLSIDEAEEKMGKARSLPRWFMREGGPSLPGSPAPMAAAPQHKMRTTTDNRKQNIKDEQLEEELDYNEDFADDEEQHALVEDEEDNKELEERIKKEMLSANALGDADPNVDDEEESRQKAKLDKEGRRVQRFLERLEKNNMYESDSSNPYASSSSEDEVEAKTSASASVKGEDEKKSLDRLRDENIRDQVNRLQNTSVTIYNTPVASEGSNLSSRRPSSTNLNNAKAAARARRHRPGLVTLRLKPSTLSQFSQIPSSATNFSSSVSKRRAGSDGYDSDRSQKKIRFQVGDGMNATSRQTSPLASPQGGTPRSGSPVLTVGSESDLITAAELKEAIVSNGNVDMRSLLNLFKHKLARNKQNKKNMSSLLKEIGATLQNGILVVK